MKKICGLFAALLFVLFAADTRADWFIDAKRFQSSVHGEVSCQDCHENVVSQDLHPNPEDVNRPLSSFFDPDRCLVCHEEVADGFQEGSHGSQTVEDPRKFDICIQCHAPHYPSVDQGSVVPPFSAEDAECMTCHAAVDPETADGKERINEFCLHCHGKSDTPAQSITRATVPLIHPDDYRTVPHADLACTICHLQAAAFPHTQQGLGECRRCHLPHPEKTTHAAHPIVSCEACHLQGVVPAKDPKSKRILWKTQRNLGDDLTIHQMAPVRDCERCHFSGNEIGAAAMVLPAKSILCMPCHAATFSAGDTTTLLSLIVFAGGILMMFSYLLSGSLAEGKNSGAFRKLLSLIGDGFLAVVSPKIVPILKALFFDVLLQRRLRRQAPGRWLIHGLIFFPFVFRFLWGMIALAGSVWIPAWQPAWDMLNKNHPATGLLFDVTGLLIIIGVFAAGARGIVTLPRRAPGLPRQDLGALSLIAGITVVGFVLEGMRIAMAEMPAGSGFAFIGYGISQLFSPGFALNSAYGYVWYLHAVLTGAFVAYIPFSRLSHIIMAPLVLAMRAVADSRHD